MDRQFARDSVIQRTAYVYFFSSILRSSLTFMLRLSLMAIYANVIGSFALCTSVSYLASFEIVEMPSEIVLVFFDRLLALLEIAVTRLHVLQTNNDRDMPPFEMTIRRFST